MRREDTKNNMIKHQSMEHGSEKPHFIMKVVSWHRTPLARQVAEAIRIRKRGGEGAIRNSKLEFSRCHIPVVQKDQFKTKNLRTED